MAKKSTKKASKPAFDPVTELSRLFSVEKVGKAGRKAISDAVKSVKRAVRVVDHEAANHDKIVAKQAKILERIAQYKKMLKSVA
jgi:hypothetical protein